MLSLTYPAPDRELFQRAANESKVPLSLLYAIARTESHFKPDAKSGKDALGLMQLLHQTAEQEGLKPNEDLYQPEINIRLGAKHLARLLTKYAQPVYAIAAYNAGAIAVDRWRSRYPETDQLMWSELIGYPETKSYVKKVVQAERMYQRQLK